MFAGILNVIGRLAAAGRGSIKMGLGLNPNQPFELRGWLSQFFQGGGAMESARESGMSSGASQALIDQVNRRPNSPPPAPSARN